MPDKPSDAAARQKNDAVNRFRKKRGKLLSEQIEMLARRKGRRIVILDVGGREDYWNNVATDHVDKIILLNMAEDEIQLEERGNLFESRTGDARDLSAYDDKSFDLAHANSVIEHVGPWQDMQAMADEMRRVGDSGWVQTPAWEFPIEPHFREPFLHWFGQPARRRLLFMSRSYRGRTLPEKRWHVDRINLLSRPEFKALFPECTI